MANSSPDLVQPDLSPYVTAYKSIGGYKAVHVWWNPDGFWEPWQTGMGAYATREEANTEAREWAEAEEMRFVECTHD